MPPTAVVLTDMWKINVFFFLSETEVFLTVWSANQVDTLPYLEWLFGYKFRLHKNEFQQYL